MRKQFCIKGHNILKVGRYFKSRCKKCKNQYYQENKKRIRKYQNKHYQKVKQQVTQYKKQKRHSDLNYKLGHYLRNRLYQALKGNYKSGSAVRDLGCSISQLKAHLEKKFKRKMSWSNYGKGRNKWNIDHIKAVAIFDLTDRKQFLKAVHYKNLQPLWQIDNIKKGDTQ